MTRMILIAYLISFATPALIVGLLMRGVMNDDPVSIVLGLVVMSFFVFLGVKNIGESKEAKKDTE